MRRADGPHTGLPCIPRDLPLTRVDSRLTKEDNETEEIGDCQFKEVDENESSRIREVEEDDDLPPSSGTVVNMATPWKISAIQEGLGGKYDRDTIIEMLKQCRGNIDRAFANLLGERPDSPPSQVSASKAIMKSRLQPSSRSSSPFSTASKRSVDDSDSEEDPRPAVRRARNREKKRRVLPDVTVGIAFRDDQNDLVSLRLRVSPDAVAEKATSPATPEVESSLSKPLPEVKPAAGHQNEESEDQKPRRSRRITKSRNAAAVT